MDLGYIPWSNKGKGKDGKKKATRAIKERVAKTACGTKEAKESLRTKVRKDRAREPQREAVAKETHTLPDTVA
eukprot:2033080-Amphidinium_carterae.1